MWHDVRAGLDDNLEVWRRDAHVIHAPPYDKFWADINKAVLQHPAVRGAGSTSGVDDQAAAAVAVAASAAAAAADAEDHNFLCGSFLPLLERVHADFFSAIDGLVDCLRMDGSPEPEELGLLPDDGRLRAHASSGCSAPDADLVPSASSCGSGSGSKADVYRGFNLSELTSPLHKDILPHTVNILRCVHQP